MMSQQKSDEHETLSISNFHHPSPDPTTRSFNIRADCQPTFRSAACEKALNACRIDLSTPCAPRPSRGMSVCRAVGYRLETSLETRSTHYPIISCRIIPSPAIGSGRFNLSGIMVWGSIPIRWNEVARTSFGDTGQLATSLPESSDRPTTRPRAIPPPANAAE